MSYQHYIFIPDMPSKYKRQPGSRMYHDYTEDQLYECLEAIRSGEMSQRQAEAHFKICRSTIKNKLKNRHISSPGHPSVFSKEEEQAFASHIDKLCEYGFPIDEVDLRFIAKAYLSRQGKIVRQFKDNLPGRDWAKSFLARLPTLTKRFASNIKRARAAVTEEKVTEYITNLEHVLTEDGPVPPTNIYNYDETNMTDDPGRKKIICRRGCKYPERVMNSTKSSTTVMFCANAAGESLPPYIIYKAEHLWNTWTEGGPVGARYNRTRHGWIDLPTFEEWFTSHLLPELKKREGKKVVIGDNLTSHLSINVLRLCQENNICFVCLPPNSSHLTQPLDVAYFRPLKYKWKQTIEEWKQTESGKNVATLPKDLFPRLLRKALDSLEGNTSSNIISGFRKSGICPVNKDEILKRLPSKNAAVDLQLVGDSFLSHLEQKRSEVVKPRSTRKKKLNVPAGQSITEEDLIPREEKTKDKKKPRENGQKKQKKLEESSDESCDAYSVISSGHSDLVFSSDEEVYKIKSTKSRNGAHKRKMLEPEQDTSGLGRNDNTSVEESSLSFFASAPTSVQPTSLQDAVEEGKFVVVSWNGKNFPGKVMTVLETGAFVDCMEPTPRYWKWPTEKDVLFYKWSDFVQIIEPPKLLKRGLFHVNMPKSF